MKKIIFLSVSLLSIGFSNVYAECPDKISHDEARMIANGEKHSFLIGRYEAVGNMKEMVVKKGTSSLYTEPRLIREQTDPTNGRLTCTYSYEGKATKGSLGRTWDFSISIPKN